MSNVRVCAATPRSSELVGEFVNNIAIDANVTSPLSNEEDADVIMVAEAFIN